MGAGGFGNMRVQLDAGGCSWIWLGVGECGRVRVSAGGCG